jgi:hypothetical protein
MWEWSWGMMRYPTQPFGEHWLRYQEELDALLEQFRANARRFRRIEGSIETTLGGGDLPPEA